LEKSFWKYIEDIPANFEVIQLTQTYYSGLPICLTPQKYHTNIWGAACYLIKRPAATRLVATVNKVGGKYDLTNNYYYTSEQFVLSRCVTYTIPLFTYRTNFTSNIHQGHVDSLHIPSKNRVTAAWISN